MLVESILTLCLTFGAATVQTGDQVVTQTVTSVMSGEQKLAEVGSGIRLFVSDVKSGWLRVTVSQQGESVTGWIKERDVEIVHRKSAGAEAFVNTALQWLNAKDYASAIADCDQAITIDENCWSAYYLRGAALAGQGEYDRAITSYTEAIRLNPGFAAAFTYRGLSRLNKRQYDLALADLDQAIQINPNDAHSYVFRGSSRMNRFEYDLAVADFDMALRLNPNYQSAYANRGGSFIAMGQADRALADSTMAIRLNPNDSYSYRIRGLARAAQGDHERAFADLQKACDVNPKEYWACLNISMIKRELGDLKGAEAAFEEVKRIDPLFGMPRYGSAIRFKDSIIAEIDGVTLKVQAAGPGILKTVHAFSSKTVEGDEPTRVMEEKWTLELGDITVVLVRAAHSNSSWHVELDGQRHGPVEPGSRVHINPTREVIVDGSAVRSDMADKLALAH